jgi:hypothetical protein
MTSDVRLEARAAIADLVHAYALAVRRDRPEDLERLFMPDGTFEVREGAPDREHSSLRQRFATPGELVSFLLGSKGKPHPIPMIHNLMVEVQGDTAHASSVMVGPIPGTGRAVFGEYADRFAKSDGDWRFAARVFTLFQGMEAGPATA